MCPTPRMLSGTNEDGDEPESQPAEQRPTTLVYRERKGRESCRRLSVRSAEKPRMRVTIPLPRARDEPGARLNAYERGVAPTRHQFDRCIDCRGPAAAFCGQAVGVGLSRALRRVLDGARQSFLGRHLRRDRVPAAARRIAPKG